MSQTRVKTINNIKSEICRHIKMICGRAVVMGNEYKGLSLRDGKEQEGVFRAVHYEEGELLLSNSESTYFVFVRGDIASFGRKIYADAAGASIYYHAPVTSNGKDLYSLVKKAN